MFSAPDLPSWGQTPFLWLWVDLGFPWRWKPLQEILHILSSFHKELHCLPCFIFFTLPLQLHLSSLFFLKKRKKNTIVFIGISSQHGGENQRPRGLAHFSLSPTFSSVRGTWRQANVYVDHRVKQSIIPMHTFSYFTHTNVCIPLGAGRMCKPSELEWVLCCLRETPRPSAFFLLWPQAVTWAWRESGWERALGFISGKRWKLRGDQIGRTLPPAPPQDCRLPHYAKLRSSLVSAASLTPALVYLPSPYLSFPADLLVFGNQSVLILESRTTPPGAVAASAAGVPRAAWGVGTRHRPCQSVETISFMGCDYSQMLYSQLYVQFLISNKAFWKPN